MSREPGFDACHAQSFQTGRRSAGIVSPIAPERDTASPRFECARAARYDAPFTEAHLKSFIVIAAITLLASAPVRSQALVDPNKVAPEYREAAEKRRAEQLRQRECALKADLEKVLPRDRTAFLNQCLDTLAAKQ